MIETFYFVQRDPLSLIFPFSTSDSSKTNYCFLYAFNFSLAMMYPLLPQASVFPSILHYSANNVQTNLHTSYPFYRRTYVRKMQFNFMTIILTHSNLYTNSLQ